MEERSELRRQISEITNSLSVSDRVHSISGYFLWRWLSGSRDTLVRERVSAGKLGPACFGHRVSHATLGPLGQPEKAMGHESRIEPWSPHLTAFCFAGFGTDRLRSEKAMKTAGRENPNRRANVSRTRAHGADGQNKSCSIQWAAKQEKVRPTEMCFFLTSPFIELTSCQGFCFSSWLELLSFNGRRLLTISLLPCADSTPILGKWLAVLSRWPLRHPRLPERSGSR
jgi:hypothetical protein